MEETRRQFHDDLQDLEAAILEEGELAGRAVERAVEALVQHDADLARAVIEGDDAIDERYLAIERGVLDLLATQAPVASDLRLLSAILHINLHLERVGDQGVNLAKIFLSVAELPSSDRVLTHVREMGDLVRSMIGVALDAFRTRDLDLCLQLPGMDDPVDRLNLGMYEEVAALSSDPERLDWALRMVIVARQLERVGDNAVDIAEQVGYLLTGEFREYTDSSHPGGVG